MMGLFVPPIIAAVPELVTVSGEVVTHSTGGGGGAKAGIRFNLDGTVDKREGGTYTQVDTATDWVRPVSAYSGTYHIKWEVVSGTCDITPFSASVWTAMSGGPFEWREEEDGGSTDAATITIHVSNDGGSTTLDSGTYTFTADDTA